MPEKPDLPWDGQFVWKSLPGEGWWEIIARLNDDLREIAPDYKVLQVKEKFGTLRFYVTGVPYPGPGYERIREAEYESARTCEMCGQPGRLRDDTYWLKTLCDEDVERRGSGG